MKNLRLATDLVLPLEATTQAIGIVAKRRAGKSYLMRRLAEQLFKAGQQIVIVDPKGDQWGIRSSADGKGPGLPVVIVGGEHGDVPLAKDKGDVVAKLVVEERVSVLLDLSFFRKTEVAVFMADFLETLYRLKAKEVNRTPMMLIIDEADAIAPQKPNAGEERMLGAADDIVRRGGQRGIGCALITQRTAVLNKNVLTQCQVLIALRTIAPQDLKAMNAWIEVHGTAEDRDTLMESLPSLPTGDAWVWSPGWPTETGIFKRIHVLPIETFDSGATPRAGEKRVEPKNLADVDIGALTKQMADTIEKARADDPKELRKEIAAHRKTIKDLENQFAARVKVPIENDVVLARIQSGIEKGITSVKKETERRMRLTADELGRAANAIDALTKRLRETATLLYGELPAPPAVVVSPRPVGRQAEPRLARDGHTPVRARMEYSDASISGVGQRIMNTIAGLAALGVENPDKATVAALVGYHPNAKSYANAMGSLRSGGFVEYLSENRVQLTAQGKGLAENVLSIASIEDLHELWYGRLGNIAKKILVPLIKEYPDPVSAEHVAGEAGYHPNAKSFANMKGRLRTLGLIDYPGSGQIVATKVLFPDGLA